jgi:hypothetical protein
MWCVTCLSQVGCLGVEKLIVGLSQEFLWPVGASVLQSGLVKRAGQAGMRNFLNSPLHMSGAVAHCTPPRPLPAVSTNRALQ